jgi:DNA-binding transcriptional ArsR family regulator
MLLINSNPYPKKYKLKAFLGDAIGHPARPFIIEILHEKGELCLLELNQIIKIPQSTLSRQVNHLARRGIIKMRVEGTFSFYSLNNIPSDFITFLLEDDLEEDFGIEEVETNHSSPMKTDLIERKTNFYPSRIKGFKLISKTDSTIENKFQANPENNISGNLLKDSEVFFEFSKTSLPP